MVSALNDERAILNTSDEGQGLHCILISKILAYLLWVGWWCDTCIVRISTIIWLAGSSVIIHFIVFKYGHTLFDCMVENILKERYQHPLHFFMCKFTLICSLSSWLVWLSLSCLNSSVWRKHDSRFSGDTKSSATLIQLWMLRT